jgi:hypothetical protein
VTKTLVKHGSCCKPIIRLNTARETQHTLILSIHIFYLLFNKYIILIDSLIFFILVCIKITIKNTINNHVTTEYMNPLHMWACGTWHPYHP